jgi:hypothetical protein
VKGYKRGTFAGKPFLGQNHYSVSCHLLAANLLYKIVSVPVMKTVKSGHSFCLSSFSWSPVHLSSAELNHEVSVRR